MNNYTVVPQYFKPVSDDEFESLYLEDRRKVERWISKLFDQNSFLGYQSLSHAQLSIWVGGHAMDLISESSFRAWTFDDYKDKQLWSRIIWRLVHLYPLGFLITNHKFQSNTISSSWNPAYQSLDDFSSNTNVHISLSNRKIAGETVALTLYMKIFGEITEFEDNGGIGMALADCFSSSPNIDNPLFVTLRRAIKKTLYKSFYPVPYFWQNFLLHLYSSIPSEYNDCIKLLKSSPLAIQKETSRPLKTATISIDGFKTLYSEFTKSIELGELLVNTKGAVVHKVADHYFAVHPLWLRSMVTSFPENEKDSRILELEKLLIDENMIVGYDGKINIPGKNGFDINLMLLHEDLAKMLPQEVLSLEDNPAISIIGKNI